MKGSRFQALEKEEVWDKLDTVIEKAYDNNNEIQNNDNMEVLEETELKCSKEGNRITQKKE